MYDKGSNNWEFAIDRDVVLEAAQERRSYHMGRFNHWTNEADRIERSLRENGLTFVTYDHSGGKGINANINQQMSTDLAQANRRIEHHNAKVDFFDAVVAGIERSDETSPLPMNIKDLRDFGLSSFPNDGEE